MEHIKFSKAFNWWTRVTRLQSVDLRDSVMSHLKNILNEYTYKAVHQHQKDRAQNLHFTTQILPARLVFSTSTEVKT
jgi:hypothetical protein